MTDTTNRPPLPAGEAVLDAAAQAMECPDGFLPYERELIAAALRAAADRVEHHWDGAECVDHLQVIAAELEAHDG